jgi:hypothetical protein
LALHFVECTIDGIEPLLLFGEFEADVGECFAFGVALLAGKGDGVFKVGPALALLSE